MAEPTNETELSEQTPMDWEALAAEKAEAFRLPVEDLQAGSSTRADGALGESYCRGRIRRFET